MREPQQQVSHKLQRPDSTHLIVVHDALPRHNLPPRYLGPVLFALSRARGNLKQPSMQARVSVHVRVLGVPERRGGRNPVDMLDALLRDEHAERDLARVTELVLGEHMLPDDGTDAVRADDEVEGARGGVVRERQVDAGGGLGDRRQLLGQLDEGGRETRQEGVLQLVPLDAGARGLVGVAAGEGLGEELACAAVAGGSAVFWRW